MRAAAQRQASGSSAPVLCPALYAASSLVVLLYRHLDDLLQLFLHLFLHSSAAAAAAAAANTIRPRLLLRDDPHPCGADAGSARRQQAAARGPLRRSRAGPASGSAQRAQGSHHMALLIIDRENGAAGGSRDCTVLCYGSFSQCQSRFCMHFCRRFQAARFVADSLAAPGLSRQGWRGAASLRRRHRLHRHRIHRLHHHSLHPLQSALTP